MTTEWSEKEIEDSRRRRGVPQDWVWSLCEAGCGDVVWHQGFDQIRASELAKGKRDVTVVLVCSRACMTAWMASNPALR